MDIKIVFSAEVKGFDPAITAKEFSHKLHTRLSDILGKQLKLAVEQSSDVPMVEDMHKTGKTWEGTAKCNLSIERIDNPESEIEQTYDDPIETERIPISNDDE